MAATHTVPSLPAKHIDLIAWINKNQTTPISELVKPYNEYEAVIRKLFAQEPSHPILRDGHLSLVPIYHPNGEATVPSRPRDPSSETPEMQEKYVMPLKPENRRSKGDSAVVPRLDEFRHNFSIFSEGSLSDMDWSNVIVAGSAVVTCLMPVPEEHRGSKRALRQFYHDKFAPASDVDIFLYGMTEEQAIEKIKQIEDKIKNAILYETTTIRTKNAITIVSQHPTRHVQIVLRIYKSISEVLTGFDVDCSCAAFDGKQVYVSPRALAAYVTQANTIDLTRRSPSYESRLSKYSHRGFEIFYPQLDRSRIDPTIYERSFSRTIGLARLLVLERLPKSSDRDAYLQQRRAERHRPARVQRGRRYLAGDIKTDWEDEVPDWMEGDEISDYHTFTIPYGPKFYARKIERLLYTKDLLLNAEWNKSEDRHVNLHRHPAFLGNAEDVIHDCCGYCPSPLTPEEKEVSEKESKIYISGGISFIKDDPGRQEIGSFNPITETDWTEMAYVGNTEQLCQAIVDHDLDMVKTWLAREDADPNCRDYTGRTPLHLACLASTPEIVQGLVDHGARLTARLADGRTALHLSAARGNVDIVKILLNKSNENEAEEDRKSEARKAQCNEGSPSRTQGSEDESDDVEIISTGVDASSYTSGSFFKVQKENDESAIENMPGDDNEQEPDIYDINVLSWDTNTSPLHLAIIKGHVNVVEELVSSYGADVLLPIKLLNDYFYDQRAAILTLVLALQLPVEKAKVMTEKLLQLGATPAQADLSHHAPLHYVVASKYNELIDIFIQQNRPATERAINYLAFVGSRWNPYAYSALMTAINTGNAIGAIKLLDYGAGLSIDFAEFVKQGQIASQSIRQNSSERNEQSFGDNLIQPVILAVRKELPEVALELFARGVNPNTIAPEGYRVQNNEYYRKSAHGKALLDFVRDKLEQLRQYTGEPLNSSAPRPLEPDSFYLQDLEDDTYQMWAAKYSLDRAQRRYRNEKRQHERKVTEFQNKKGTETKMRAIKDLIEQFQRLEAGLVKSGAKTFRELFPDIVCPDDNPATTVYTRGSRHLQGSNDPFKVKFTFNVPDLTDRRRGGYIKLYEAAWCGDLDTIKALTLAMWGENDEELPLQIAVTARQNNLSPFSIAVLRGHAHVAKAILKIVQAQHKKEDKHRERFEIDDDCSDGGSDDSGNIRIYREIIDDNFTIDNIGEARTHAESTISSLQVLYWNCPAYMFVDANTKKAFQDSPFRGPSNLIEYAIWMDNPDLLALLLDLGQEAVDNDSNHEGKIFRCPNRAFHLAISEARLGCLEVIIKRTGGDLPLDALVAESGVTVNEKPKFYQGLSIHGKKRADWANRGLPQMTVQTKSSPLLISAVQGNLKSTEWYMSTAPSRYYLEFMDTHDGDKRLQLLAKCANGPERPLMGWLNSNNHLVLHCAILARPTLESRQLIQYLVQQVPGCLEAKSSRNHTPLAVAYSLHRVDYADILIDAGASQTTRDANGNNLIHLLLCGINRETNGKPENVERLLSLLDPRLTSSLLVERSSDDPGSVTPLARWMHNACSDDRDLDIARRLLKYAEPTGQHHLELLDGSGNTPVHNAIKRNLGGLFELMVDYRPDLLYRENATGSTPLELQEDAWVHSATRNPPHLDTIEACSRPGGYGSMVDAVPGCLVPNDSPPEKTVREICHERASGRAEKRKLVTLNEANEVAKRLATRKTGVWCRYGRRESSSQDEVVRWYHRSNRCHDLTDVRGD
ncbi:hypothetical protein BDV25DRAFT_142131 [Aspergillus avenaceus]|uniref:Uncharacterized protein n=1 Tax=Aspergillus avenaceus TaxID=36643 RepID=A0A5N6TP39_ASPAV|nr:hypothetical protein BDV25DRAFT_142131 [Aspergillus avenaceus]